eukprot:comp11674_c0_seq2/m.6203 comp11674_c0_seq2/g.6203  ORF comp11674_c0_seq2/g.6203 comp11674_c0_seq2/m.6203 type:complete len:330 (+) comp11674_c0_seq2:566-1555(+)
MQRVSVQCIDSRKRLLLGGHGHKPIALARLDRSSGDLAEGQEHVAQGVVVVLGGQVVHKQRQPVRGLRRRGRSPGEPAHTSSHAVVGKSGHGTHGPIDTRSPLAVIGHGHALRKHVGVAPPQHHVVGRHARTKHVHLAPRPCTRICALLGVCKAHGQRLAVAHDDVVVQALDGRRCSTALGKPNKPGTTAVALLVTQNLDLRDLAVLPKQLLQLVLSVVGGESSNVNIGLCGRIRLGQAHLQALVANAPAVQPLDGLFGGFVCGHDHKPVACTLHGLLVLDDACALHHTELGEEILEFRLAHLRRDEVDHEIAATVVDCPVLRHFLVFS